MPTDAEDVLAQFDRLEENRQSVFTGIYLTLFSVAGGVALGLIATALSAAIPEYVSPLALEDAQWTAALLSLSTLFILGAILSGYVLTVSYFYWEPTEADVVSPLLLGLSVCMAAAYVGNPPMWLLWLSAVAVSGWLSYKRSEWVVRNGEVLIVEELADVEFLREEMQTLKERQLAHLRRNKRLSLATGLTSLAWGYWRGWFEPPYRATVGEVAVVTAVIIAACGFLAHRYRAAFEDRSEYLGSKAKNDILIRLREERPRPGEG